MKNILAHHRAIIAVVAVYVILGIGYSVATPVFEASDEIFHYPVVQHIAEQGELPVQRPGVTTMWEQEGSQPPLYYLLSAALTFWIDTSDLEAVRWQNPHAKLGIPLDRDNRNMVIHTQAEQFPWRGTVLAVHLIRFLGIAMGAASVSLTYMLGRTLWPERNETPLLAATLVAFNPMFLFISASVNNDNLMVLLATWLLLLVATILQQGLNTHRGILLAVLTALATITKISGLTLLPLLGLTLVIYARNTGEWRKVIWTTVGIILAWVVFAGWWYLRNLTTYGELLGLDTHLAVAGTREIALWQLPRELYGFWVSYWGLFGAVNILMDSVLYWLYGLISIAAVCGLIWWATRQIRTGDRTSLLLPGLLALQIGVVFTGLVRWTLQTYASQGRLMFPVIAALSLLTAHGLLVWASTPRRARAGVWVACVSLALIAGTAPFRYIMPIYAPPPTVTQIPDTAVPIGADFGGLELVAVQTSSVIVSEGGRVPVTLYWRANRVLDENYSLFLHAHGREYEEIGKIDSYPGGGLLPTTMMLPGAIIEDYYEIELDPQFETPTAVRVIVGVGVWTPEGFPEITAMTASGELMDNPLFEAGIAYPRTQNCPVLLAEADAATFAEIGGFAHLSVHAIEGTYHPGDTVPLILYWDRMGETTTDWTVFVHVINGQGEIVAQADSPPLNNDYPTYLWRRPCQIADVHLIELPEDLAAGSFRILVGMYNASDPVYARASAVDADGTPYPDSAVPIGTITVESP